MTQAFGSILTGVCCETLPESHLLPRTHPGIPGAARPVGHGYRATTRPGEQSIGRVPPPDREQRGIPAPGHSTTTPHWAFAGDQKALSWKYQ